MSYPLPHLRLKTALRGTKGMLLTSDSGDEVQN